MRLQSHLLTYATAAITILTSLDLGCTTNTYIHIHIRRDTTMAAEELIAGPLLGQLMAGVNDQRQLAMQGRLMEQQSAAQMALTKFNQQIALDTWDKTNYAAQVRQLEKAGLNVGLMYKQGGPGGSLQVTPGSVTGGQAPHGGGEQAQGLQLAMSMKLMAAQADQLEAAADASRADAEFTRNQKAPQAEAQTKLIISQTGNVEADTAIKQYNAAIAKVNASVAEATAPAQISQMYTAAATAIQALQQATIETDVQGQTKEARITQIKTGVTEQAVRISAAQAGIKLTQAEVTQIGAQIKNLTVQQMQNWDKLAQQDKQLAISKALANTQADQLDWKQRMDVFDRMMPNVNASSTWPDNVPLSAHRKEPPLHRDNEERREHPQEY